MNFIFKTSLVAAIFGACMTMNAQGTAPSGSTGQCKDGSYTSAASKSGACRGHKGIQTWFAASAAPAAKPVAAKPAPAAAPAPTMASRPAAPAPAPMMASKPSQPAMAQAPGGGAGTVWVNTSTKVYHCPTDRFYGKTKKGSYLSEADAKAKGFRPDAGKACK